MKAGPLSIIPFSDQLLCGLESSFGNDCGMGFRGVVLIYLSMVSLFSRWKTGSESLLKQCVPAVPFIGKNVVDSRNIPLGVSETSGNLACG